MRISDWSADVCSSDLLIILPAASAAGAFAWKLNRDAKRPAAAADAPEDAEPVDLARIGWDEVTDTMQVNLDIGYGLVPLVDERRGAPLMGRITGVRRQLSKELGFVVSQAIGSAACRERVCRYV